MSRSRRKRVKAWIDESYRAVAPKTLVARLADPAAGAAASRRRR